MTVAIAENEYSHLKLSCDYTIIERKETSKKIQDINKQINDVKKQIESVENKLSFASDNTANLLKDEIVLLNLKKSELDRVLSSLEQEKREKTAAIKGFIYKLNQLCNECCIELNNLLESLNKIDEIKKNEIVRSDFKNQIDDIKDKKTKYTNICKSIKDYISHVQSDEENDPSSNPASNMGANSMNMGGNKTDTGQSSGTCVSKARSYETNDLPYEANQKVLKLQRKK